MVYFPCAFGSWFGLTEMKIAVIGTGISGLVAAKILAEDHEVTVFEADERIGGHTHTVDVDLEGQTFSIDTGFIVYNETTYPHFCELLDELHVKTQKSDMSFSLSCEQTGLEWGSIGLGGVFAQRRNLARPRFLKMLLDVLRFNREAPSLVESLDASVELGDLLIEKGYSDTFTRHYIIPMGAAIWSARPSRFLKFSAKSFIRFFMNHGLLASSGRLEWRVLQGGSRAYLEPLTQTYADRIFCGGRVERVSRRSDAVEVRVEGHDSFDFDRVVLAVHSDQALAMLANPTKLEAEVLSNILYRSNDVLLHTDASVMPKNRRAWASWNYRTAEVDQEDVFVSYHMNRLQGIESEHSFFVTLNGRPYIDPESVLGEFEYHHPIFDAEAVKAQERHGEIDGADRIHYCGAYWGWGFHEDGVRSAKIMADRILGKALS